MTFLPIVGRELRVAARRRSTYWVRFGVVALAILISGWLLLTLPSSNFGAGTASYGPQIFGVLAGLGFVFCLTVGPHATADCLSAEKRDGTLGLLFLTDLKGFDVVLGKLTATSLGAFYALVAILPMMALPLLLGGLSPGVVVLTACVLVNTLFFSLAAGMFVSAVSRDERRAVSGTVALILCVTGVLPAVGGMIEEISESSWRHDLAWLFYVPSPVFAFVKSIENIGSSTVRLEGVWSILAVHGEAWLLFGLACVILPRTWSERTAAVDKPGSLQGLWHQWCFGDAAQKKRLRERLLEINPVTWLSGRNRFMFVAPWIFLGVVATGWVIGYWRLHGDWLTVPADIAFAVILHTFLKYHLAGQACRRFAEDRRAGALELLLSTPLGTAEIVRGQWLALRREFLGPIAAVLAADVFLLACGLSDTGLHGDDALYLIITFLAGMVVLVADAFALSWLGMWRGLSAANFTRAWSDTMFWVLLLPWTVFVMSLMTVAALQLWRGSAFGFGTMVGWWLFLSLTTDMIVWGWARTRVNSEFREQAASQYQRGGKTRRAAPALPPKAP